MTEQINKKQIEEIIVKISCPKDFVCYKSGFENLCKAEDIWQDSFLKCLEDNPRECVFSISFGYAYYCKCPLRVYIAKTLRK
jgi:hypothetical protein